MANLIMFMIGIVLATTGAILKLECNTILGVGLMICGLLFRIAERLEKKP